MALFTNVFSFPANSFGNIEIFVDVSPLYVPIETFVQTVHTVDFRAHNTYCTYLWGKSRRNGMCHGFKEIKEWNVKENVNDDWSAKIKW